MRRWSVSEVLLSGSSDQTNQTRREPVSASPSSSRDLRPCLYKNKLKSDLRFVVVQGVSVVVVGGVGPVETLQPLLLLLHKVGVGAGAGGGQPGQAAVGPWLIPGGDGWRRRRRSRARRGDRSGDLHRYGDGDGGRGRGLRGDRNRDGGHTGAVVGMVGGGGVVLLLVVVVLME